jgi:hypothetical protein
VNLMVILKSERMLMKWTREGCLYAVTVTLHGAVSHICQTVHSALKVKSTVPSRSSTFNTASPTLVPPPRKPYF